MSSRVVSVPRGPSVHQSLLDRGAELIPSTAEERADLLDDSPWARPFSWEQVRCFAGYFRLYRMGTGRTLFREGDHDAFLTIILSGTLEIHKHDLAEQDRRVASVGKGKMVGEMSLLDGGARSASAVAAEESSLLVLTKDAYDQLAADKPTMALDLTLAIASAIAQLLRQTTGALVEHLPG